MNAEGGKRSSEGGLLRGKCALEKNLACEGNINGEEGRGKKKGARASENSGFVFFLVVVVVVVVIVCSR